MIEGSLARRYAKALLSLAAETGKSDEYGAQLDNLVRLCTQPGGDLVQIMANPSFTPSERKQVLEAVLPRLGLDSLVANFVRLVLDKDRFNALPDIAREYGALADAAANRVRATVTTAFAASADAQAEIAAALSASTGKTVIVDSKVDARLLGGMVARVGDRVFDASLRTRLEQLQVSLATTALG